MNICVLPPLTSAEERRTFALTGCPGVVWGRADVEISDDAVTQASGAGCRFSPQIGRSALADTTMHNHLQPRVLADPQQLRPPASVAEARSYASKPRGSHCTGSYAPMCGGIWLWLSAQTRPLRTRTHQSAIASKFIDYELEAHNMNGFSWRKSWAELMRPSSDPLTLELSPSFARPLESLKTQSGGSHSTTVHSGVGAYCNRSLEYSTSKHCC